MHYCAINGVESQLITSNDRGLAYGDGLFTTGLVQQNKLLNFDEHLQRLLLGSKRLGITAPSKSTLISYIDQAIANIDKGVVKIIITSGSSGRGYARSLESKSNCIVMVSDFPEHYETLTETGIKLGISNQKIGINPMLSGLKHLNRLEQVLLRAELEERDEDDLVVLNIEDKVIEATSANLFYCIEGKWFTPKIEGSGVKGLMRQNILNKFDNIIVQQTYLDHLNSAQAMFICNSVAGIIPVHTYENRPLSMELVLAVKEACNESNG